MAVLVVKNDEVVGGGDKYSQLNGSSKQENFFLGG
jgi:hypothetical protein